MHNDALSDPRFRVVVDVSAGRWCPGFGAWLGRRVAHSLDLEGGAPARTVELTRVPPRLFCERGFPS